MEWWAWLNLANYISQAEYLQWWTALSDRFLVGLPIRMLATALLAASCWCGIYKMQITTSLVFFLLALMTAYLHPWMQLLGLE